MKLSISDFERTEQADPLVLYRQGIRASETCEKYTRMLRLVLCDVLENILQGTFEERAQQIVMRGRSDPDWVRDLLLSISRKLRERTTYEKTHPQYLNPSSFANYFKPIKKLMDTNDVVLPWGRINSTFPEEDNLNSSSRGWTRVEIQRMLTHGRGPIDRAIILVAASSGIRVGGFEGLQWRDLTPIYYNEAGTGSDETDEKTRWRLRMDEDSDGGKNENDIHDNGDDSRVACARLQIYRGSAEEYPAFITPEAYAALCEYGADWARRVGRQPEPREPIFIRMGDLPRRATKAMIKMRMQDVMKGAGLRPPPGGAGGRPRRHEVPIMNGFRRFWNKSCKEALSGDSALSSLIKKEYMMGHAGLVSLDRNYFKAHVLELAEEYLNSVPALTIGDADRLRAENARQTKAISKMKSERDVEIEGMRKMLTVLAVRVDSKLGDGGSGGNHWRHAHRTASGLNGADAMGWDSTRSHLPSDPPTANSILHAA